MSPRRLVFASLAALACAACDDCKGKDDNTKPPADAAEEPYSIKVPAPDGDTVNATVLPTELVAKRLNPENLPVYNGDTGSIEGTITTDGDPPLPTPADFTKCPGAEKLYGTSFRQGDTVDDGKAWKQPDAIVGVTGYTKFYVPEKTESRELRIEGCGYRERTMTVTYGQRIDVKNMTRELWTPILEPGPTSYMMMATPGGDPVHLYPKKPGEYLVVDHDRRYAVVDVRVLLFPLHTVTDANGHFRIDGVPVGKVTLFATHPRMNGDTSQEIEVKPGLIETFDLRLHHVHKDAANVPPLAPTAFGSVKNDAGPAPPKLR